jgi:hypothetical protein
MRYLLLALTLAACDIAAPSEGPRGPAGPAGAPGAPGPEGAPAVQNGSRLRAEGLTADDGARAWTGTWRDTERDESCAFTELAGELRCLPRHRTQLAFSAWASPTCAGARASKASDPDYIRETETEALYRRGAPILEAWGAGPEGECISLGAGVWYAWEAVPAEAFVGADVVAD